MGWYFSTTHSPYTVCITPIGPDPFFLDSAGIPTFTLALTITFESTIFVVTLVGMGMGMDTVYRIIDIHAFVSCCRGGGGSSSGGGRGAGGGGTLTSGCGSLGFLAVE